MNRGVRSPGRPCEADHARLRVRAARQAQRNLYGPLRAGGIGDRALALIDSFEEAR